ncbi:MAG TPA: TadE family type IV pilus minor pilin [Mycobacteriales bacterium]|nr:TadE family type IV pilus minor pilin [Mycobacteriales bacterium]
MAARDRQGSAGSHRPRACRCGERGTVTAELAVALPVLVVLLVAALTAVSAVTTQMRCVDAAREAVRAAARGEVDGAALGRRVAPPGATVTVEGPGAAATGDGTVSAVVSAPVRPLGRWLPAPAVSATAVAAREPGGVR